MGEVFQFAGVVAVITIAGLGWRWSTAWLRHMVASRDGEIEALEERVEHLEERLRSLSDGAVADVTRLPEGLGSASGSTDDTPGGI